MNKLDSDLVIAQLSDDGFDRIENPDDAGVIIFNTCSVRQHAEDKVLTKVNQFKKRYQQHRDVIIAIIGCMAQRMGQQLLDENPQVAVVCGPGQLHELSDLIQNAVASLEDEHQKLAPQSEGRRKKKANPQRIVSLNNPEQQELMEQLDSTRTHRDFDHPFMAYVRVMKGCNNFCHYCIVPYVRGREYYRPIENIVDECKRLADDGIKEIILLGQAVNSYKYIEKGKTLNLADVIERVNEIDSVQRIRFVTSYPRDFDYRIFEMMAAMPKVCSYLHMPAQTGSGKMLKAMNRHYTIGRYDEIIEKAREIVPDIAIAGDFIAGYCGETEQDQQQTLDLIKRVRYKNIFAFFYSPRPGTKAYDKFEDNVPMEIKKRRLKEILDLQNEIAAEYNQNFIGKTVEVLVEGPSKKTKQNETADSNHIQLTGRTQGDHIVVFDGTKEMIGTLKNIKIEKTTSLTLFG
ncbi:MAG: tRNA (N6-isopentenyl adenosine(37)-C2)-methylthiotransferase MiaB [Phycisphaerae bacterium]|nr:tRNA (N6-isopentenyl adenosine(37)-C2)-methylthiotransferase MiaB [Phycisphaerae bacterium]